MTSFRIMLLSLGIALAGIMSGCNDPLKPEIDIIQIEGVHWVCNVTTSYAEFGSTYENEGHLEISIPVSAGDMLYMLRDELQLYYRYSPEDGTHFAVSFDTLHAISAYMNGRLSYMELTSPESIEAFTKLSDAEITQLSALYMADVLTEDLIPILEQHENSIQGKGLILENNYGSGKLQDLLSILRPKFLVIDDSWTLPEPEEQISLSSLELLWVEGNIPALARLASCCSNLESLIIADWDPEQGELLPLSTLNKLKTLTIAESSLTTLGSLDLPENLHSLYLIYCDTLTNVDRLHEMENLQALSLVQCNKLEDLDALQGLESLQRLSFPPNTSQKEFRELTDQMSLLETVELVECPHIEDLSPLQGLPELKILLLQLKEEQVGGLESLQELKLLVLTDELFIDNDVWIKDLRESLPNTEVVPGSGICLGSGWLLLLLPLILIFRYFFRRKV
jgi:hypothetical protein